MTATTREQRKAATRATLLAAAIEVFTKGSVVNTPLEEVARVAGVSKATLFFHFGTRIELLEAVAADVYRTGVKTVWRPTEPGLVPFVRAYLASHHTPGARLLWEIGDVLAVSGRPGPDEAYLHLIEEIDGRLNEDGVESDARPRLARLLASATLWVARRVVLDQAAQDEVERFVADVETTLRPLRGGDGQRAAGEA